MLTGTCWARTMRGAMQRSLILFMASGHVPLCAADATGSASCSSNGCAGPDYSLFQRRTTLGQKSETETSENNAADERGRARKVYREALSRLPNLMQSLYRQQTKLKLKEKDLQKREAALILREAAVGYSLQDFPELTVLRQTTATSPQHLKLILPPFWSRDVLGRLATLPVLLLSTFAVAVSCCVLSTFGQLQGAGADIPDAKVMAQDEQAIWKDRKQLQKYIKKALDIEGRRDIGCCGVLLNRPWKPTGQPEVKPPVFSSNEEWLEGLPFPNGETRYDEFHRMVCSTIAFIYKKRPSGYFVLLQVFRGVLPAIETILFARIVDEIGPDGKQRRLFMYSFCLVALELFRNRASYVYLTTKPAASVRMEMRERLQRQFLKMRGSLAESWPSGRCVGVLDHDVQNVVNNIWLNFFNGVELFSGLVALVAATWYTQRGESEESGMHIPCSVIFCTLCISAFSILSLRTRYVRDMAVRKRDWRLSWFAVATAQLNDEREGRLQEGPDEAARQFGAAGMVYKQRSEHSNAVNLMASTAVAEMAFFARGLLAFFAGVGAQQGNLTRGQAMALIAAVDLLAKNLASCVKVGLGFRVGYTSLTNVAEVFNVSDQEGLRTK